LGAELCELAVELGGEEVDWVDVAAVVVVVVVVVALVVGNVNKSSGAVSLEEYETVIVGRVGRGVGDRFLLMLERPDSEDGFRGLPDEGGESDGENEARALLTAEDSTCLVEMGGGRGLE
jgi:hypothetical protein